MKKFKLNRKNLPKVTLDEKWPLKPEGEEAIYQVGEWSLSKYDDPNPQDALNAIHSWIAWYEYLVNDKK